MRRCITTRDEFNHLGAQRVVQCDRGVSQPPLWVTAIPVYAFHQPVHQHVLNTRGTAGRTVRLHPFGKLWVMEQRHDQFWKPCAQHQAVFTHKHQTRQIVAGEVEIVDVKHIGVGDGR